MATERCSSSTDWLQPTQTQHTVQEMAWSVVRDSLGTASLDNVDVSNICGDRSED